MTKNKKVNKGTRALAHPDPSSSSSHPTSSPRPPASFSSLPPELKGAIAQHVHETDKVELKLRTTRQYAFDGAQILPYDLRAKVTEMLRRDSKPTAKEPAKNMNELFALVAPCRTGLAAFNLLNRECYLVARPLLWESLVLSQRSCDSLVYLIRNILPRHGSCVKSLDYDHYSVIEKDGLYTDEGSFASDDERRMIKAAEKLGKVEPLRSLLVRRLRTPGLLIAEVIKQCPNIEEVDFVSFEPAEYELAGHWNLRWEDHAFLALVAAKPRLTSITFELDCVIDGISGSITRLLSSSASTLKRLDIRDTGEDFDVGSEGYRLF
ncbi:hypothetical protein JCM8547_002835 [Rhodosporidiobolus lusitaniae]